MSLIKDRRGDATDPLIILVIIFFLAVSFVVVIFVNTKISLVISDTSLNESTAFSSIDSALDTVNVSTVQRGFVLMFALIIIFAMVSAFLVRVHPAFFFIYMFVLAITLFSAVFIGNVYGGLQDNPTLNEVMVQQPIMNFIMNNIVKIMLGIGALTMVISFSKLFGAPVGNEAEGGF